MNLKAALSLRSQPLWALKIILFQYLVFSQDLGQTGSNRAHKLLLLQRLTLRCNICHQYHQTLLLFILSLSASNFGKTGATNSPKLSSFTFF